METETPTPGFRDATKKFFALAFSDRQALLKKIGNMPPRQRGESDFDHHKRCIRQIIDAGHAQRFIDAVAGTQ